MPIEKKTRFAKTALRLFAALLAGVLAVPSSSEAAWRFFISTSAGKLMRSEFPFNYRTGWWDLGTTGKPYATKYLYEVNFARVDSKIGAGFSIGFGGTYQDIDPDQSFDSFWYGALIYHPGYSFADATESESRYIVSTNAQGKIEDSSAFPTYTQSGRKSYLYGAVFGCVLFPLKRVPLGVDLSLGLAIAKQKFSSGFWKANPSGLILQGSTDSWDAWETYEKPQFNASQGGWKVGDLSIPVGFGLRYFLGRSWSIDLLGRFIADRTRTIGGNTYIYSDATTEKTAQWSLSIGTVVSLGLTYIF